MNNIINFARKYKRGRLERSIVWNSDNRLPGVEQSIASHRYPTMPKIVVYSAAANSDSFLSKIFPFYTLVTPSLTAETDDLISRRIANQLTEVKEEDEAIQCGYLIKGFPFNSHQALQFDRYLNGVNLAIHLKTKNESPDYLSSIQSLLAYYEQRGTLLQLEHSQDPEISEIQTALHQIRIKIKRSL